VKLTVVILDIDLEAELLQHREEEIRLDLQRQVHQLLLRLVPALHRQIHQVTLTLTTK